MANEFVNLPMPVSDGPGAAADVSTMAKNKTIVVSGSFAGCTITIEVSVDGGTEFWPLCAFQSGSDRAQVLVAATHMRAVVSGRNTQVPFSASADVGALPDSTQNAPMGLPVLNGPGASADISAFGVLSTIIVSGTFPKAAVLIEISEDGSVWAPLVQFSGRGGIWTGLVTADMIRAKVSGRSSGSLFDDVSASICACDDSGGGAGDHGGDRGWYGTGVDGEYESAGDDEATRDMYFTDWTIHAGDTYVTNGFKMAWSGTLTIEEGGFLDDSGTAGDDGGDGAAQGTVLGGGNGGAGHTGEIGGAGLPGDDSPWWPLGDPGKSGGDASGGVIQGGDAGVGYGAGPYTIEQIAAGDGVSGGAGGAGGSALAGGRGGNGGGGGGVMVLKGRFFVVPDNSIRCRGGVGGNAGGAGNADGGGGGMGGVVLIITDDAAAPVCDVSGGTGGTANYEGGNDGDPGDDGIVIAISPIHGPIS